MISICYGIVIVLSYLHLLPVPQEQKPLDHLLFQSSPALSQSKIKKTEDFLIAFTKVQIGLFQSVNHLAIQWTIYKGRETHTLGFWTIRPFDSSFISTVEVKISAPRKKWGHFTNSDISWPRAPCVQGWSSLFSKASPLFFRIVAIVTTVVIAATGKTTKIRNLMSTMKLNQICNNHMDPFYLHHKTCTDDLEPYPWWKEANLDIKHSHFD